MNEEALIDVAPRFWGRFITSGINECWEWPHGVDSDGYGQFGVGKRNLRANRMALLIAVGPAPEDKPQALHSCDNPPCVNPGHLRWGSNQENMEDRDSRKRRSQPKGESHGCAKLTEEKVLQIRSKYLTGKITLAKLGAEFGISEAQVSNIVNRKKWTHL